MTDQNTLLTHLTLNKKELVQLMIPDEEALNAKTIDEKKKLADLYFTKFKRAVLNEVSANPKILECTIDSIYEAVTKSLRYQLELGRECYLVPYNNKIGNMWIKQAKFQADYKGWLALARRSPQTENIDVQPVYEKDIVRMRLGDNPTLTHELVPFTDRGKLVGVYAIVWIKNSKIPLIEPMTVAEVDKIRKISKQPDGNAWKNHYGEMARKTVLHKVLKRAPREIRKNLSHVFKEWEDNFEFSPKNIIDVETTSQLDDKKNLITEQTTVNPIDTLNAAFDEKEKVEVDTRTQDEKDADAIYKEE